MEKKQRSGHSLKEIAATLNLSIPTTRKWIQCMIPGIYIKGKRKGFFTQGEYERILAEFDL